MDEHDRAILDFLIHITEMLTEGVERNCGVQMVIYPDDVKDLYTAFKAKGFID